MRAALTVLGILIGVAAVVIVTALGTGVQERITGEIQSLGSNIDLHLSAAERRPPACARAPAASGRLTEGDGKAIVREATSVGAVVPLTRGAGAGRVSATATVSTQVMGTTHGYFAVRGFTFATGAILHRDRRAAQDQGLRDRQHREREALRQRRGRRPDRARSGATPSASSACSPRRAVALRRGPGRSRSSCRRQLSRPRLAHLARPRAHAHRLGDRARARSSAPSAQIESILRQRHHIEPTGASQTSCIRTQAEFLQDGRRDLRHAPRSCWSASRWYRSSSAASA